MFAFQFKSIEIFIITFHARFCFPFGWLCFDFSNCRLRNGRTVAKQYTYKGGFATYVLALNESKVGVFEFLERFRV